MSRPQWLTASPYDREIARLAVPAFGALIAEPLYLLADTAVVARLGTDSLDGLALAAQPLLIGHAVFIFLAYGTTAAVGRLLGAGEQRRAAHQAVQSVWLAAVIGLAVLILGQLLAEPLVALFGGELGRSGPVRNEALTYLRISLFGFPFLLMSLAGVGYLRGLQDTVRPLVVSVGSATLNLVLELVLIYGFDFGIGASAFATVVAQVVAAGLYVHWIRREVRRHGVGLGADRSAIRSLAGAGVDLFWRTLALRGSFTVATAAAARLGSVALAAHQITFELWSFLALGLDAIAIAGQAIVARMLGAGDPDEARAVSDRMVQWGAAAGVATGLLVLALRPVLPQVFSPDEAVQTVTALLLVWMAVSQPVNGVVFALDGILIGAGDLRFLAKAMWVAALLFIPWAVAVVVLDLGVGWLWAGLGLFMVVRLVTLWIRYRTDRWLVVGAEMA
ncbi:MAG: MATE family efflux transporter [Acidimicrobiia bacterium]|nr:MATE family efflux transporter [Acidimicrobiia bacterium]